MSAAWQVSDPNLGAGWEDAPGDPGDAEGAARAYLADLDPREAAGGSWILSVRHGEGGPVSRFEVRTSPCSWVLNGRRLSP